MTFLLFTTAAVILLPAFVLIAARILASLIASAPERLADLLGVPVGQPETPPIPIPSSDFTDEWSDIEHEMEKTK